MTVVDTDRSRSLAHTWRPILDPADATRAEVALRSIVAMLSWADLMTFFGASVSRGAAGAAVFFSYSSRAVDSSRAADPSRAASGVSESQRAGALLSRAIATPAPTDRASTLFAGRSGVAWTVQHLGEIARSGDVLDPRPGVDDMLLAALTNGRWTETFDLVSGLVGCGVYALERRTSAKARTILSLVIDRLAESATTNREGCAWRTEPEWLLESEARRHPRGYVNLGLAHGLPCVISLLGQACAADIAGATARPLLERAVAWLLAHRRPTATSNFASIVVEGVEGEEKAETSAVGSRLAWCHGDLGVAVALFSAAANVGVSAWRDEALDIAHDAATRDEATSGVTDAGFCHGASGVAHVFNRFYQATGEQVFLDASRRWFKRTLDFCHPNTPPLKAHGIPWLSVPGLLEGAAGIGLALLAATTTIEPEWDRLLMISLTPSDH